MNKIIIVVMLFFSTALNAQIIKFEELGKYSRFGILVGGALYEKAKIKPEFGDITFKNIPIPSYIFGFEYDFYPKNNWSIITAFNWALEPAFNLEAPCFTKDSLSSHMEKERSIYYFEDTFFSFSIPIFLAFREKMSNQRFLEFRMGIKLMYFSHGHYGTVDIDELSSDDKYSTFLLSTRNTNTLANIYGSFIFGAGVNILTNWSLIKINMFCNINFQNPIEGEYLFYNLPISKRNSGKYYLSGDYLGLNVVFHLNRDIFKHKSKKG